MNLLKKFGFMLGKCSSSIKGPASYGWTIRAILEFGIHVKHIHNTY